ncbi:MAG: fibronectin type III domain-containing protein [Actinomycetota bacterium]
MRDRRPAGPGRRRRRRLVAMLAAVVMTGVSVVPARWALASFLDPATATSTMSTDTLAAPSNLTSGLCLLGSVTLSWTASPSTWADGYEVRWGTTSGGPYTTGSTTTALLTTTVTGLSILTTYYFVVRAYDGAWRSPDAPQLAVPC